MIGHSERVGGHRCTGLGRVAWAGLTALLVVIPVTAVAQAQPPRLDVYSGTFGPSSGPAPGSSSGAELTVDVPGIDPLEVRLEELRQLMADHLAETSPHWEHGSHQPRMGGDRLSTVRCAFSSLDAGPGSFGAAGALGSACLRRAAPACLCAGAAACVAGVFRRLGRGKYSRSDRGNRPSCASPDRCADARRD